MTSDLTGLRGVAWQLSYRTSTLRPDGRPLDILHEFYIPALQRSVRYDRVAGYFRSSSLAAASQGFSAFVGRQGHMRLIVGADLDPEDVRAILQGSEARLTALLTAQLEGSATWPETVRRGVELLAWMVAQGYLEVRVAFRVHTVTGEPLAVDALDDGYVHMKWAIFTDAQGLEAPPGAARRATSAPDGPSPDRLGYPARSDPGLPERRDPGRPRLP